MALGGSPTHAIYGDGPRAAEADDFAELHADCESGDAVAWLGLYEPSKEAFSSVARRFGPVRAWAPYSG